MQVRDTASLTVNGTALRDVELYGSAKLTASGAAMGHLQTRDGTPAASMAVSSAAATSC